MTYPLSHRELSTTLTRFREIQNDRHFEHEIKKVNLILTSLISHIKLLSIKNDFYSANI